MKFSKTVRTYMTLVFEEGTVSSMSGTCEGFHREIFWTVHKYSPSLMTGDKIEYGAWASPLYGETVWADNLEDLLNKLEALIEKARKVGIPA